MMLFFENNIFIIPFFAKKVFKKMRKIYFKNSQSFWKSLCQSSLKTLQVALSQRVRHYLTCNQIKWERFGRLVLGIGQARLSVLLGHPKPWSALRLRVKTYYQRMLEWMETRATYGSNPYMKYRGKKLKRLIKPKKKVPVQRFRGLFQWDTGRSEMEMQNAIDYLSRMNEVQQVSTTSF